ncbi:hypothetical protein ACJX0J_022991 [Zea mays]
MSGLPSKLIFLHHLVKILYMLLSENFHIYYFYHNTCNLMVKLHNSILNASNVLSLDSTQYDLHHIVKSFTRYLPQRHGVCESILSLERFCDTYGVIFVVYPIPLLFSFFNLNNIIKVHMHVLFFYSINELITSFFPLRTYFVRRDLLSYFVFLF